MVTAHFWDLLVKDWKDIQFYSYATFQAAQQERSTFISSLLPLLSEYDNLQPSVLDAQSIVGNLKVCSAFLHYDKGAVIWHAPELFITLSLDCKVESGLKQKQLVAIYLCSLYRVIDQH